MRDPVLVVNVDCGRPDFTAAAIAELRANGIQVVACEAAPADAEQLLAKVLQSAPELFDAKPVPSAVPYYRELESKFQRKRKWR